MLDTRNIQSSPYLSSLQKAAAGQTGTVKTSRPDERISFGSILEDKLKADEEVPVKFSKHAQSRLSQRGISLTREQMTRLAQGMDKASGKGIKEPLVLIDDLAFIVSTDKKTVITAVDQGQAEDNIFTNIDGAVIN